MRAKGWTITTGSVVALITGTTAYVSANAGPLIAGFKELADLATISDVESRVRPIADSQTIMDNRLKTLGEAALASMIANLEDQIDAARRGLLEADKDLAANPTVPTLQITKMEREAKLKKLEARYEAALCSSVQIVSAQGKTCRSPLD